MTPDDARAEALSIAEQLLSDMQSQQRQLDALTATEVARADIQQYVLSRLEPLARAELEAQRDEAAADVAAWQATRTEAFENSAPDIAKLASVEGTLEALLANAPQEPDIREMSIEDWEAAEEARADHVRRVNRLRDQIQVLRPLIQPLYQVNGAAVGKLEQAERTLATLETALSADQVLATTPGQGTHIFRDLFLLFSGLWLEEKNSPIGLEWLKRSGKGAEIQSQIEAGVRADIAAHGPEFRSAPSAVPLWGTTSEPGVSERWGTASESGSGT